MVSGIEVIAIGSLIDGAVSALNSTAARTKARKERQAQARPKAYKDDGYKTMIRI
jgi:hypothetical protein